jgi:hypothetical protein
MKLKSIAAISTLLFSFNANAADFSYTYAHIGTTKIDLDIEGTTIDGNSIDLSGAYALNDTFYVKAGIGFSDYEYKVKTENQELGLGAHMSVSNKVDLFGEVAFLRASVEISDYIDESDTGTGITLGARAHATETLEISGGVKRVDVDDIDDFEDTDADNIFFVKADYRITKAVDLELLVAKSNEVTSYGLGARFNF